MNVGTEAGKSDDPAAAVHSRDILRLYWPLALSWLLMAVEAPFAIAVISRMPDAEVNTAAMLLVMSLALWIESPVIDLLSTGTTLVRNSAAFRVLSKFTVLIIVLVTVVHAAVALTPIYDWLTRSVIRAPQDVVEAGRWAMVVMIPWSGFIGWRRFLQGVLIRAGHTRQIGVGTGVRVVSLALSAWALMTWSPLTGVTVATAAVVASVIFESLFIYLVGRRVMRALPSPEPGALVPTLGSAARFHWPLTAATMVMMMGTPLISATLARTSSPVLAMAAWQVAFGVVFLHRAITFALPEVVIALSERAAAATLRSFCFAVGGLSSIVMLVAAGLRLDEWLFTTVLKTDPEIARVAHVAYWTAFMLPILNALMSYVRGMLTAHRKTGSRLVAISVGLGTLFGMLSLGLALKWPGVVIGTVATTVGAMAELAVLVYFWRAAQSRPLFQLNARSAA
ncbi:MAG: hypothetical protein ACK4XJ_00020 [Fimbriimonadaceae bacterium]